MIVVDASVAAKWILAEPHTDRAEALYSDTLQAGEPIVVPALLLFEITNVLRRRMVRAGLTLPRAQQLVTQFLGLALTLGNPSGLHQRALALADAQNLPAAYDAQYLALAESLNCDFWTDDQRLIRSTGGSLPFVRAISTYPIP